MTTPAPYWRNKRCGISLFVGDALETLRLLPEGSVDCCVTSPPYWNLRDYGVKGQMGLEPTPEAYCEAMVEVFREVRRVLKSKGTIWVNIGDSYATKSFYPIKPKDLIGVPWMLAFALRADGWFLRSDIIWHKPNPMPESIADRPTKAHEYIFLLSKSKNYFYDAAAIREEAKYPNGPNSPSSIKSPHGQGFTRNAKLRRPQGWADSGSRKAKDWQTDEQLGAKKPDKQRGHRRPHAGFNERWDAMTTKEQSSVGSNKRSVWTVPPATFKGNHYATFPPKLIEPCILAGCPVGGTVLDPFAGTGTVGEAAIRFERGSVLIELNPAYADQHIIPRMKAAIMDRDQDMLAVSGEVKPELRQQEIAL